MNLAVLPIAIALLAAASACGGPRFAPAPAAAAEAVASARAPAPEATGRPRDPWVFRSVLDGNARALTAALDHDLWIAFDVDRGELWRVWRGDVRFTGTVYDTLHGPQPTARGPAYFEWRDWKPAGPGVAPNPPGDGWRFATGETAELRWRGHRFLEAGADGRRAVELAWELRRQGRIPVEVRLKPEAVRDRAGLALRFDIAVEGLGEGEVLMLDLPPAVASVPARTSRAARVLGAEGAPRALSVGPGGGRIDLLLPVLQDTTPAPSVTSAATPAPQALANQ